MSKKLLLSAKKELKFSWLKLLKLTKLLFLLKKKEDKRKKSSKRRFQTIRKLSFSRKRKSFARKSVRLMRKSVKSKDYVSSKKKLRIVRLN